MGSRHFLFLLVLSLSIFAGSALNANQQFKFYMTSASGYQGDSVELNVLFDNEKDQVCGWSLWFFQQGQRCGNGLPTVSGNLLRSFDILTSR